jgi:Flp pilus assembly protein TadB
MSGALAFVFVLSACGFFFFTIRWLQLRSGYRSLSSVEKRYAEMSAGVEESKEKENRRLARLRRQMREQGWPADVFTIVSLAAFAYLTVAVGLRIAGISDLLAAVAAAPTAVLVAWFVNRWAVRRRTIAVNKQLVVMMDLMVSQVKSGVGAERALMMTIPALPNPLHGELVNVMDAATTGSDLVTELAKFAEKYPSRAFNLFLAALEIDRAEGNRLEPALTQASDMLKKTFALQSEARAELSSVRWEFIGVTGVICLITFKMVLDASSGTQGDNAFTTPVGLLLSFATVANVLWGIIRFNRLMDRLSKETQ